MNKLQKWLSYFFEIPIEKVQSNYSGTIEVLYHKNAYKLTTENTIYSFGNYYTSFKKVFDEYEFNTLNCTEVLVLGIGLGSVVNLLENNTTIKNITAVDIDATIIDLCKKYLNTKHNINYIQQDAYDFVVDNQNKYELILVDLFINATTPQQFLSIDFLQALKNSVSNKAYIVLSKLALNSNQQQENEVFEQNFKQVFANYQKIFTDGNLLFVVAC
ncbi:MAG: methyltransferase domain-containing protein [Chitinophagales bacterium]|nr:methyltransferase domain-containing protein [Chitinophagales bacterium]